jgi:cytochrome c peroxidase
MRNKILFAASFALFIIYSGCQKEELQPDGTTYSLEPKLPSPAYDYSNGGPSPVTDNVHLPTLGRVLFYDQKMSLNNSVSCGSCHQQKKAFADGKQFSTGLRDEQTRRNSPAIIKHNGGLFWDGRAENFHDLVLMPLENHVEMLNYDLSKLEAKVAGISYYPALFTNAFGSPEVTIEKIQTAVAAFMQNFNFSNNKNLQVMMGTAQFTPEERAGIELFWGKAKCINCHSGQGFEGWSGAAECIGLDETYQDNGVGELTHSPHDNAKFRIPSLLNIEYTAPYMHDGRFNTLEEVVEHYNSGVKNHPNLSWDLKDLSNFENLSSSQLVLQFDNDHNGFLTVDELSLSPVKLNLTTEEKRALVAFLKTLSDPNVFTDERFSDPFVIR